MYENIISGYFDVYIISKMFSILNNLLHTLLQTKLVPKLSYPNQLIKLKWYSLSSSFI